MADLHELQRAHEDLYDSYEDLAAGLGPDDWDRETGCPGWTVRDVLAHVVGVEAVLSGDPEPDHEPPGELPHVRNDFGLYMEVHVDARRRVGTDGLVAELRDVFRRRRTAVAAIEEEGQEIGAVMGATAPAARVLSIRVLDLWMHEQDLRRVLDRPGHRGGPAADVSLRRLEKGLASELPGRLSGTSGVVVLQVAGDEERTLALDLALDLATGERLADVPAEPTVTVHLDLDGFVSLAGGRADAPTVADLAIDGDHELGERVVAAMAITP